MSSSGLMRRAAVSMCSHDLSASGARRVTGARSKWGSRCLLNALRRDGLKKLQKALVEFHSMTTGGEF